MYKITLVDLPVLVADGIRGYLTNDEMVATSTLSSIASEWRSLEENHADLFMLPFRYLLTNAPDIFNSFPHVSFCVWADNPQPAHMKNAYLGGAIGCLSYDCTGQELTNAVRAFQQQQMFFGSEMSSDIASNYFQCEDENNTETEVRDRLWGLSDKEIAILKLLTRGLSNKQIAPCVEISEQTVKNHLTSIYQKMKVHDRTQAVVVAFATGFITPDLAWLDLWNGDRFGNDAVSDFRQYMPLVKNKNELPFHLGYVDKG